MPTPKEGNKNLDTLPPNFDSRDCSSSVTCPTFRGTGVSPPSHMECSLHFATSGTINPGVAETQPLMQRLYPPNTSFQKGSMMADELATSKCRAAK